MVAVHSDSTPIGTCQRIANFQVCLASGYLADIAPSRCGIVDSRVVHPLRDFVARNRDIAAKLSASIPAADRVSLECVARICVSGVIAENAALRWVAFVLKNAVEEEDREGSRGNALRCQAGH